MKIDIQASRMAGVFIIKTQVFNDERGSIWTTNDKNSQRKLGELGYNFCHDKFNQNKKNVLRGIHYDNVTAKLVTCVSGKITQFVINIDESSENFGEYMKFELSPESGLSILLPPGMGNAFISREHNSVYYYKLSYPDAYVDHLDQGTINWSDSRFDIDWDIKNPILSARDSLAATGSECGVSQG